MANSIIIKSFVKVQEEYTATAVAITPGMLLELTSSGTVQAHSAAGGNVLPMFAFEDELQGRGIDTAYGVSTKIQCIIPRRGDIINAVLADGENISIGDMLESNGAGALRAHVADQVSWESANPSFNLDVIPNAIVGVAVTAEDLSDSANLTATGRIQVRII